MIENATPSLYFRQQPPDGPGQLLISCISVTAAAQVPLVAVQSA